MSMRLRSNAASTTCWSTTSSVRYSVRPESESCESGAGMSLRSRGDRLAGETLRNGSYSFTEGAHGDRAGNATSNAVHPGSVRTERAPCTSSRRCTTRRSPAAELFPGATTVRSSASRGDPSDDVLVNPRTHLCKCRGRPRVRRRRCATPRRDPCSRRTRQPRRTPRSRR